MLPKKIPVTEAYKLLGITKESLTQGLKQNCFPFGVAVKHEIEWSYFIWLRPLLKFLDMSEEEYEEWKEHGKQWKIKIVIIVKY